MALLMLLLGEIAALVVASLVAVAARPGRAWAGALHGACLVAALVAALLGLAWLLTGDPPVTLALPVGLPGTGLHLRLDGLSAFFLLVVGTGGTLAALWALGHAGDDPAPRRTLPWLPLFLAAMQLVCLADDAFAFLVAWETMSLVSFALVLAHRDDPAAARAAVWYLAMAGFGTACLLLAMGVLAGPAGHYAFDSMRARELPAWQSGLVLLLVLAGCGSKAGLVPLHVWLPLAHPAAPSHVSALMSGAMTKVAVYGLVRLLLDLAGPPAWWWAAPLLVLGAASAVLGLMGALLDRDLKRVLAWSTIENLGVVTTALGFALAFQAAGLGPAAALALVAGLLHCLNHAVMKSLLFLGAGSVLHGTGTRDLERLGGLIRVMPVTAATFLVGAASIAALPPLNGFVSEWLLFQAVLLGPDLPAWLLKVLTPAVGALLALAAALAAACFVRAFGIAFLGRPRSDAARDAHEPPGRLAAAGLVLPAVLCVLLGVFPGPVIDLLAGVTGPLLGATLPLQGQGGWLSLRPVAGAPNSYDGLVLLVFLAAAGGTTALVIHRLASDRARTAPVWDCGWPDPSPATQYSAASMAQPLRRVFGTLLAAARERVSMPPPLDPAPARLEAVAHDLAVTRLYDPFLGGVAAATGRLNGLQYLTIRRYLALVFAALVTLLLVTAVLR